MCERANVRIDISRVFMGKGFIQRSAAYLRGSCITFAQRGELYAYEAPFYAVMHNSDLLKREDGINK